MTIDRNNNPMVASTLSTSLVIFSTPCVIKHVIWTDIKLSTSLVLCDNDQNLMFKSVGEPNVPMRVFEDAMAIPNGLAFSTSAAMSDGKLFVHIK